MTSTDLRASDEWQSIRIERKFTYKWIIRNFCCQHVTYKDDLPATKFELNYRSDLKFIGELSLRGERCRGRQCNFILKSTTHPIWKVYAKLWVGEDIQCSATIYLDQISHSTQITLSGFNGDCLLAKGNFTIVCEIIYVDYINERNPTLIGITETKFSNDFVELFKSKKNWDVTLIVAGHEVHAHKCILASRSKVFAAMFDSEMEEAKTNKVTITDINPDVFEEMLRYIYTNDVLNLNKMASKLLAASDKYDLKSLKFMCENELANILSIGTAAETLILSDLYKAEDLKERVINFIRSNSESVGNTEGWRKLALNNYYLLSEIYLPIEKYIN